MIISLFISHMAFSLVQSGSASPEVKVLYLFHGEKEYEDCFPSAPNCDPNSPHKSAVKQIQERLNMANRIFEKQGVVGRLILAGVDYSLLSGTRLQQLPPAAKEIRTALDYTGTNDYLDEDLEKIVNGGIPEIHQLRLRYQADIVIIEGNYGMTSLYSGKAGEVGTDPEKAFIALNSFILARGTEHLVVIHEIGHLFGLTHSHGTCDRINGQSTIMENNESACSSFRLPLFSQKGVKFLGTNLGKSSRSETSVEALNRNFPKVSRHFESL